MEEAKEYNLTNDQMNAIIDTLNYFDFDKVHCVMENLDWCWAPSKEFERSEYEVPTVKELRVEASRLLKEACARKTRIAMGGFEADYVSPEDTESGKSEVVLRFILEDA